MSHRLSNVIGFDDAPFERTDRSDVRLIGAVCTQTRLDGVVSGHVQRDGFNSTDVIGDLIANSKFQRHVQAILLQGVTVAGFNVVDVERLSRELEVPVLVVARYQPNFENIRQALAQHIPEGQAKWRLIERLGSMEPLRSVFVQRSGLDRAEAERLLAVTTLHGNLPEPLRLAHIIAGGVATGVSKGRA